MSDCLPGCLVNFTLSNFSYLGLNYGDEFPNCDFLVQRLRVNVFSLSTELALKAHELIGSIKYVVVHVRESCKSVWVRALTTKV